MKVYVCTSGSYSDYQIDRIFLDKELAEKFNKYNYHHNDIEEWEISDSLDDGKIYHNFHVKRDFEVRDNKLTPNEFIHINHNSGWSSLGYTPSEYVVCRAYNHRLLTISMSRNVFGEDIDLKFYENKYKKAFEDYCAIIFDKYYDGWTVDMINESLKGMSED